MRKLLGTLAVLTLAFGLTACGGAPAQTSGDGSTPGDSSGPAHTLVMYYVNDVDGSGKVKCVASKYSGNVTMPSCDWGNAE